MIEIRAIPADSDDALALVEAMVAEVMAQYGFDAPPSLVATAEMMPPDGGYVTLYQDDLPVAGGGFRRLDATAAEIKRMYVAPSARGQGLSKRLLAALEVAAGQAGYRIVRLDTGPLQTHAMALYTGAGYREIDNFNGDWGASYFGEKHLPFA